METEQFLARVIPPGNFFCITYNTKSGTKDRDGFRTRMFAHPDFSGAAGYAQWCAKKGWDVYHSMGSFAVAEPDGVDTRKRPKFRGKKEAANVQNVKAFWMDLDVIRAGDGKDPKQAYATRAEAGAWIAAFTKKYALPRANMVVNSGYGLHVYWVLMDPMTSLDWAPYSSALKAMMLASGFKGDVGITGDAARILRPSGTMNCKVLPHQPVAVLGALSSGEIPNATMLGQIQPFVVAQATAARSTTGVLANAANSVAALAGGNVTSMFAGQAMPNMAAAAAANMPTPRLPRSFAEIAKKCGQVAASLADHGKDDEYPLWYLGHLTLAHFCTDGAAFVHPIGDGSTKYTPAGTDAAVAQIAAEHARINNGPPSCFHYSQRGHTNVCQACPFFNKITGPWDLGVTQSDLPVHYRRANGWLQVEVPRERDWEWINLIPGDVSDPLLDVRASGGHDLSFTYTLQGNAHSISVIEPELPGDPTSLFALFSRQFVTIPHGRETRFREFIVSWIAQLRDAKMVRAEAIKPFGWATTNGVLTGFAVGGTLYKTDGTEAPAPGGDREMVAMYQPRGTLEAWMKAAAFAARGRPDQQVVIASSFAAPLMRLAQYNGVIISEWSRGGGIGKTAGMNVAQAAWGTISAIHKQDDTPNAVMHKVGATRAMPAYWDECSPKPDNEADFVSSMFQLTQGTGKARLNPNLTLRAVGEWETIMLLASNRPMLDMIQAHKGGTNAGELRCFEWHMDVPSAANDPDAQRILGAVKDNYGRAGRLYARFMVDHLDAMNKMVDMYTRQVTGDMSAQRDERFFIATCALIMTAARVINKLGLVPMDLPAIKAFLYSTFAKLRADRKVDSVVSDAGYNCEEILGNYMSEMGGRRLVTDRLSAKGGKVQVQVVWHPQDPRHVDMQVAQREQVLRINRHEFSLWCRKKGFAGKDVADVMHKTWGGTQSRATIGGGTGYGGGFVNCIEIPLLAVELEPYRYDALGAGSNSPPPSTTALATRPAKP